MNGISLMIAVAAVGIDVGWEAGPGGQLYYTIKVEQPLLKPLREGKAIKSAVDARDRNLRKFQIIWGDNPPRYDAISQDSRRMVAYGWRPSEDGGMDYMIQLSPERLETLARGVPIVGEIDERVTDIRHIWVFTGLDPLPQELPPQPSGQVQPPEFLKTGGNLEAASAQLDTSSSTGQTEPAGYGGSRRSADGRGGSFAASDRTDSLAGDRTRNEDWRTAQPSSGPWPPQRDHGAAEPAAGSSRDAYSPYSEQDRDRGGYSSPRYASRPAEYEGRDDRDRQPQGSALQPTYADRSAQPPAYNQGTQPAAPALQPPANTAAQTTPVAAMPPAWQQAYAAAANPAIPNLAAMTPPPATESTQEQVRPWTPLILTTLSLFASLGANAYLGWLAWSFFWRYRDAASDLARARG